MRCKLYSAPIPIAMGVKPTGGGPNRPASLDFAFTLLCCSFSDEVEVHRAARSEAPVGA